MRIKCLNGFFLIDETEISEISKFQSLTGLSISPKDNYFTFSQLKDSLDYSLVGKPYLNLNAIKNYEGNPWEVFKENGFIYDFSTGLIKQILSITNIVQLKLAGSYYVSDGLIIPGSFNKQGKKIESYECWYISESNSYLYTWVSYV